MFKIWDKVIIMSLNQDEEGEDLKYYSTIDGIQIKEGWDVYTVNGKRINPAITHLATEDEIKEFYKQI